MRRTCAAAEWSLGIAERRSCRTIRNALAQGREGLGDGVARGGRSLRAVLFGLLPCRSPALPHLHLLDWLCSSRSCVSSFVLWAWKGTSEGPAVSVHVSSLTYNQDVLYASRFIEIPAALLYIKPRLCLKGKCMEEVPGEHLA